MSTHFYTASSLDGFIATHDHSLDWLLTRDFDREGPMAYPAFTERIGAIIMGASTYEWLLNHGPAWEYDQPVWVCTHRRFRVPAGANIHFVSGDVRPVHERAVAAAGAKDVWVMGGGDLAGQFADAGLLDEVWVQIAPVTLGAGKPLLPRHLNLALIEVAQNRDFVCVRYRVANDPPPSVRYTAAPTDLRQLIPVGTFKVGDETFVVQRDADGSYHYDWVTGRNAGYGFSVGSGTDFERTDEEHLAEIREFLREIDPDTGYLS